MLKKMSSSFFSFIVCALSLGCPAKGGLPAYRKPVYPDKDLKEIVVYGSYSALGGGGFVHSRYRKYCYNETKEEDKRAVLNKNLWVRLYDQDGNLLSEDFLRFGGKLNPESQNVISYLPYHDEGYKFRVVRLEEKKEIVLKEVEIYTQEELREMSFVDNEVTHNDGWVYNEESECHIAAFD